MAISLFVCLFLNEVRRNESMILISAYLTFLYCISNVYKLINDCILHPSSEPSKTGFHKGKSTRKLIKVICSDMNWVILWVTVWKE